MILKEYSTTFEETKVELGCSQEWRRKSRLKSLQSLGRRFQSSLEKSDEDDYLDYCTEDEGHDCYDWRSHCCWSYKRKGNDNVLIVVKDDWMDCERSTRDSSKLVVVEKKSQ